MKLSLRFALADLTAHEAAAETVVHRLEVTAEPRGNDIAAGRIAA